MGTLWYWDQQFGIHNTKKKQRLDCDTERELLGGSSADGCNRGTNDDLIATALIGSGEMMTRFVNDDDHRNTHFRERPMRQFDLQIVIRH